MAAVIDAVVLAGGARDAVCAGDTEAPNKAFIDILGKTMVARTIAGLRACERVGRITVVAPDGTQHHPALYTADEWRASGPRIADSLRAGIDRSAIDRLVLVATSDLPLLNGLAVDDFLSIVEASHADVAYACLPDTVHYARFPDAPHTWARFRDGRFCGGGLVALRPRIFPALEQFLDRLGAARKNPVALASIFGWDVLARYALGRLSIGDAERRASALLRAPAAAGVCRYAEVAFNVDRPEDLTRAATYISRLEALQAGGASPAASSATLPDA